MSEREREERSESHVIAERREKLARLRDSGVEPFPHSFEGRTEISSVRAAHEDLGAGEETEERYRVAGRVAARRGHGKAAFLDLVDGSGRIQLHAREDALDAARSVASRPAPEQLTIALDEGLPFEIRQPLAGVICAGFPHLSN